MKRYMLVVLMSIFILGCGSSSDSPSQPTDEPTVVTRKLVQNESITCTDETEVKVTPTAEPEVLITTDTVTKDKTIEVVSETGSVLVENCTEK